jgi:hypothetical protein
MRRALCVAILVCGIAGAMPPAHAELRTKLRQFLPDCSGDFSNANSFCFKMVRDIFHSWKDICPPRSLSDGDAVAKIVSWMRNANVPESGMAEGHWIDAEMKAVHTLWPCPK